MKYPIYEGPLLNEDECDEIIALFGKRIGKGDAYGEKDWHISKKTTLIQVPLPIFRKIDAKINEINADYFGFQGKLARQGEIYRYDPGDFFDWHMDLGDGTIARRKLTTLIQLSSPRDYTGGRLEILSNVAHKADRARGTLLIYPSFIMHRVTKLKTGRRFSLGGEFLGKPFV